MKNFPFLFFLAVMVVGCAKDLPESSILPTAYSNIPASDRTRTEVCLNAPYVYLCYSTQGPEYEAYVCIPHGAGQKVTYVPHSTAEMYFDKLTVLDFSVTQDEAVPAGKFFKRVTLAPQTAANAQGLVFNPSDWEVKVVVSQQVNSGGTTSVNTKFNKVLYGDADLALSAMDQVAFDCPYTYLTNPTETGTQIPEYYPYCIVPLKDFQWDGTSQTYDEAVGNVQGNCRQEVTISAGGAAPTVTTTNANGIEQSQITNYREITPLVVLANNDSYPDPNGLQGWFELKIIYGNTASAGILPRKGRVRNLSSDTH